MERRFGRQEKYNTLMRRWQEGVKVFIGCGLGAGEEVIG
jgi:hypothetical protein